MDVRIGRLVGGTEYLLCSRCCRMQIKWDKTTKLYGIMSPVPTQINILFK